MVDFIIPIMELTLCILRKEIYLPKKFENSPCVPLVAFFLGNLVFRENIQSQKVMQPRCNKVSFFTYRDRNRGPFAFLRGETVSIGLHTRPSIAA